MINYDSDYEADDVPHGLLEGLEQLASALDAQHYPGPPWSPAPAPRPQRRGRRVAVAWSLAAVMATVAGIALAAIILRPAPAPPAALPPAAIAAGQVTDAGIATPPNEPASPDNEVAGSDSPQVVVVEDLDSYSLIDMSGDAPIVSYMSKDASSLEQPVPVPLGLQPPRGTSDRML
jgi:hypothetical protein